jgi:hypothetical protein
VRASLSVDMSLAVIESNQNWVEPNALDLSESVSSNPSPFASSSPLTSSVTASAMVPDNAYLSLPTLTFTPSSSIESSREASPFLSTLQPLSEIEPLAFDFNLETPWCTGLSADMKIEMSTGGKPSSTFDPFLPMGLGMEMDTDVYPACSVLDLTLPDDPFSDLGHSQDQMPHSFLPLLTARAPTFLASFSPDIADVESFNARISLNQQDPQSDFVADPFRMEDLTLWFGIPSSS